MSIIYSCNSILPPETFQRRNHIVEVAFDPVITFLAHFDSKRYAIQHSDRLLIFAIFPVRITLAPDSDVIHSRNLHYRRFVIRHIVFLVFFFEVKSHIQCLLFSGQAHFCCLSFQPHFQKPVTEDQTIPLYHFLSQFHTLYSYVCLCRSRLQFSRERAAASVIYCTTKENPCRHPAVKNYSVCVVIYCGIMSYAAGPPKHMVCELFVLSYNTFRTAA